MINQLKLMLSDQMIIKTHMKFNNVETLEHSSQLEWSSV